MNNNYNNAISLHVLLGLQIERALVITFVSFCNDIEACCSKSYIYIFFCIIIYIYYRVSEAIKNFRLLFLNS